MSYVLKLIDQGEHQQQDFKTRIEDSRKISRTLAAFANSQGGRLLIGVKDNGKVSGVNAEEEYHMIEAASEKPTVLFTSQIWKVEHKTVLEIIVEPSDKKPHFSQDDKDTWSAYFRVDDENIKANGVLTKVWEHRATDQPSDFQYTPAEEKLFQHLRRRGSVGFKTVSRITQLSSKATEELLAQLISWRILKIKFENGRFFYLMRETTSGPMFEKGKVEQT
jgi:predicted HTH transcriptional regulator